MTLYVNALSNIKQSFLYSPAHFLLAHFLVRTATTFFHWCLLLQEPPGFYSSKQFLVRNQQAYFSLKQFLVEKHTINNFFVYQFQVRESLTLLKLKESYSIDHFRR